MAKSKIFFWLLISFILGVAVASFLRPSIYALGGVFVLGGAVAVLGLLRTGERQVIAAVGFGLIMFSFGIFWFWNSGRAAVSFDEIVGAEATIEGIVDAEPGMRPKSQSFVVKDQKTRARILVTARLYPEYAYGDFLKLSGKINKPENFSEDFDYAAYLAKDDIFYTMSFPQAEVLGRGQGGKLRGWLFKIKEGFSRNLDIVLPEPHASFMAGLILGERKSFSAELNQELQTTGTTHLVALSGYNITIVGDALLKFLMFLFIPFSWAFIVAVAGIILFTVATGAAASVVRAAIMGVLVLVARREGRRYRIRNALALAAAIMLLANPKVLRFDIGFQLSFLATLGLVYAAPVVDQYFQKLRLKFIPILREAKLIREDRVALKTARGKGSLLGGIFTSTLAAQILVLPLLVYRFGRISFISPAANLAVLPFIPATMFFGFLTGGLGFAAEFLSRLAGGVSWLLLGYELSAIKFFAALPLAAIKIPGLAPAVIGVIYSAIGYWLIKNSPR